MIELFVPLGAFAMMTISVALVCRLIATASLNKTIREALRSDPGSVPVLADKLEARQPWADALLGWIFLAFAAAIVALGLFEPSYDQRQIFQAAVVPVAIGITILVYVHFAAKKAVR
jgi:ABC-type transport system involved in cytochrome c biogenesis permease subunit